MLLSSCFSEKKATGTVTVTVSVTVAVTVRDSVLLPLLIIVS